MTRRKPCAGCGAALKLKPFWIFNDTEAWWVNRNNLIQLCANCHLARVTLRNLSGEHLPAWWSVARRLASLPRDYYACPPPPPKLKLRLRQTTLL